jgi:hypothetical protein
MGEGRRVPPSRRSPDAGDRSGHTVLEAPPASGEASPQAAAAAADDTPSPEGASGSGLPLPRRVRGTNGARTPGRVEPPVLPDSFLERFRAAAAASEEHAECTEREERKGGKGPGTQASPGETSNSATESKQAAGAPSLPKRVQGANGAPIPPPRVRSPFSLGGLATHQGAPEETTQPIPVIAESSDRESVPDSGATGQPEQGASASLQVSLGTKPENETAAETVTVPPSGPTNKGELPSTGVPAAREPAAPPAIPAQRSTKRQAATETTKSGAVKERTGRSYRMVGLLVIAAALAIGTATFAALHHSGQSGHKTTIPSADIPLMIRNSAAAWVASQIATQDVVACDPVMCQSLQTRGMAAGRLRVLWPGSDNLVGCSVVVATPVVQGRFGARLDAVYAPGIIARFGSGDREIAVRAVAPHGAAAYRSDLGKDLSDRKASGAILAAQASAQLSATEKKELAAGQVDSRVIVAVAEIEAKHPVRVRAFGDSNPGVIMATAPFRSADLVVTSKVGPRSMLAALGKDAVQDPRYRAAHAGTIRLPSGQTVLRIQFAAPSLLGLLAQG